MEGYSEGCIGGVVLRGEERGCECQRGAGGEKGEWVHNLTTHML